MDPADRKFLEEVEEAQARARAPIEAARRAAAARAAAGPSAFELESRISAGEIGEPEGVPTPPPTPTPTPTPTPPRDPREGQRDPQTAALLRELEELRRQMESRPDPAEIARQERQRNRAAMMATVSWLPSELIDMYVNEWVSSGQSELAWAMVRTSKPYDQYFPSIRREDGTLRMSEQDYMSHKDAFQRELRQFGLNPELFEGRHAELIAGEVSAQEFRQRIDAKATGVLQNLPEIREKFGEFYGIANMTDEALIASALDPNVGLSILQGRITAAQISGEAQRLGFDRGMEASERLAQAGGLDQMRARDFYAGAARAVPRMERFSERFETGRPSFGIGEYEEAGLFGTTELQRRMRRLHMSEISMFQQGPSVAMEQGGAFTGLGRR